MDSNTLNLYKSAVAEGTVLLENRNNLLPLSKNTKVAVFGRGQFEYYKSGTGSGKGTSNKELPTVFEALTSSGLCIDSEISNLYKSWISENPFDDGGGVWAGEPWCQKEMPLDENAVKGASERNGVAIIIIGRSAGEDHDNSDESGSFRLTETEENAIKTVTKCFDKVIVAINSGNIIDLSFVDSYKIDALLYLWQGGMCGTEAFADIITGKLYPSGKLTDTQAFSVKDYPSTENFSEEKRIVYAEDIYVGYRYFETFAKEKVRYPFGYGITYTNFSVSYTAFSEGDTVTVNAQVKNIGNLSGKQTVQVYFKSPCGELGTPARQLVAFAKTKELKPQESTTLSLSFSVNDMASYDDSGASGNKSCYVLQKGDYTVFAGTDVRTAQEVYSYSLCETKVVKKLNEALAPAKPFKRFKACETKGEMQLDFADVPLSTVDTDKRISENMPSEIGYTGDKGIKLKDVKSGKSTLKDFIAQLTDRELAQLVCGEGVASPKTTPGAAGAIGGLTEEIAKYGIPVCCVADGPCGLKITTDKEISLIPSGTLLASTWNAELVESIYECIGKELKSFEVDALLGPGVNIHRNPLCGRNFEYYSEDPLLSGKMAVAATLGIAKNGSYSTVKHLCCNNREKQRSFYDVYVSERALREIYLKPFEIAVKEGKNVLIMTAYNIVNGYYCASNYDLTSYVLRNEWGFDNFVMTDWWANCNTYRFDYGDKDKTAAMIKGGNDVYMVWSDSRVKAAGILKGIANGYITRGQLQSAAMNLCRFIIETHTFKDYIGSGCKPKRPLVLNTDNLSEVCSLENPDCDTVYGIDIKSGKSTALVFKLSCSADALSQIAVDVKLDNVTFQIILNGTSGEEIEVVRATQSEWVKEHTLTLKFPNVINIKSVTLKQ